MDEHVTNERYENLYAPAGEELDFGSHGIFDDRAQLSSAMLTLTMQPRWLPLGSAVASGAVARVVGRRA